MSVKISDLTEATEVANNDLLAIVDVSDTTMASSGTTKKVELSKIIPKTLITQFGEDDDGVITQKIFHNTTGSAGTIYFVSSDTGGYYEIAFTGEFDVHINNTTSFYKLEQNTVVPIWGNLFSNLAAVIGYFSISWYIFNGNTYVYWYFLDENNEETVRLYDLIGSDTNIYNLPDIKLFDFIENNVVNELVAE